MSALNRRRDITGAEFETYQTYRTAATKSHTVTDICGVRFSLFLSEREEGNSFLCAYYPDATDFAWGIMDIHMDGVYVYVREENEDRMACDLILLKMGG